MIVVLSFKRTGKSSLVLSTLNSLNVNCIFIDVRKSTTTYLKKFLLKSFTRDSSLGF